MKAALAVLAILLVATACGYGGQMTGRGIDLGVSATWNGTLPPLGTTATVDFYVMLEGTGNWTPIELDVPYPGAEGTLVDTFWYEYEVPANGDKVTYRYEVDMTVGAEVYSFVCEGNEFWWYAAGEIHCRERER